MLYKQIFYSALLILSITLLGLFILKNHKQPLANVKKWFILLDYDPSKYELDVNTLKKYNMAVLDPDSHPDLSGFPKKTVLIAYLSLGEAESYRSYWKEKKGAVWIVGPNPDWPENYFVDVRADEWETIVLGQVVPNIIKKGFKGLMLDTLDTAAYLEELDPLKYKGSKKAMAELVRKIKEKYPDIFLLSNNGFAVLEEIAPYLSGAVAEDINMIPGQGGTYIKTPERDRMDKIRALKKVVELFRLPVFNIDYAGENDMEGRRFCIESSDKLMFVPYVAEKGLSKIYEN